MASAGSAEDGTPGFFGKLPARGDFVGQGLPRSFVDPWDRWWQDAIARSRDRLGEAWLPAWLEAPIWRFLLPAGSCGPAAMIGLWMPSVDRAGRHFPLSFARPVGAGALPLGAAAGWLDLAEAAGLAALEEEIAPDQVAARIAGPWPDAGAVALPEACRSGAVVWWTLGGPRVPAGTRSMAALPDAATFAAMLDAGA